MKPVMLDVFSGAGGAAYGYSLAGFDLVGVDHKFQKHYPFAFVHMNAVAALDVLLCGGTIVDTTGREWRLSDFAAIHASPPCQKYSLAAKGTRREYVDLLPPTRELLQATRLHWVIENVPGAPIRADFKVCGCQVDLRLRRLRYFETSWEGFAFARPCHHDGPVVSVVGHGTPTWVRKRLGFNPTIKDYRAAMGITWMNRGELSQAVPPAYTFLMGGYLLAEMAAHDAATSGD